MNDIKEFKIKNSKGQELNVCEGKDVDNLKGIIVLLHGIGAHHQVNHQEILHRSHLHVPLDSLHRSHQDLLQHNPVLHLRGSLLGGLHLYRHLNHRLNHLWIPLRNLQSSLHQLLQESRRVNLLHVRRSSHHLNRLCLLRFSLHRSHLCNQVHNRLDNPH